MNVEVNWEAVKSADSELWQKRRVLYALIAPDEFEVLYLGKADKQSVKERWNCEAKERVWSHLEKERKIYQHWLIVGHLHLNQDRRFSSPLLSDIESLLIKGIEPSANDKCRKSRISRPGLVVKCSGDWSLVTKIFIDAGY